MVEKRLLIVDDDISLLNMLQTSLSQLDRTYQVSIASDAVQAMNLVQDQPFDLVLSDYMMPGMTGIDLARAVRQVAPHTAIILMTAYGTNRLKDTSKYLGIDAYLDKPFTVEELYEIVKNAVDPDAASRNFDPAVAPESASVGQPLRKNLQSLLVNANARGVLLLYVTGQIIEVAGQVDDPEIDRVGKFVTANFNSALALTQAGGSQSAFKSGYFEWDSENIYVYNLNNQFLLAVIFRSEQKPGVVWFYTRQTAEVLSTFLISPAQD